MKSRLLSFLVLAVSVLAPTGAAAAASSHPEVLVARPTSSTAHVARIVAPTVALTAPDTGKFKLRLRTQALWGGGANQLLVLDSRHDRHGRTWLKVLLPVRPNGSTGWIPKDRTSIGSTHWRIVVSTGQRKVRVYRDGHLSRTFLAVVGADGTPTPHGHYAIYEKIAQRNPASEIGPWALHLTAFSNVLDNFGGGPGRVAIHGRNGAYLIAPLGTAASHGCIRVDDAEVGFLARVAISGTPVSIVS
jgi:lipoprotein-anchoring transpeptidase ErfK/SrfK